ncbi:MAG TPA: Rieske 2Fe-2S domain-containing protein, partial [Thermobifida alba]|nr:Rieske 2Fe-2S domain-containing protein [Thermobifida alba]
MRLGEPIRKIERYERLDRIAAFAKQLVDRAIPEGGKARDLLHGVPLGHPAHPVLVQVPIGAWLSATLLDMVPGSGPGLRRSAHLLVNVGLLAAVPTAVAGWVDLTRQHERQQRTGVVHALTNGAGIALFGLSSLARSRGQHPMGALLGAMGMGAVAVGGMLGGHLSYYRASGANRADYLIDRMPSDWQEIGRVEDFPEGRPTRADVGEVPLAVVRTGGQVRALVGVCAHLGGPLDQGEIVDGDCIRCPWHGSTFRAADGVVVHGLATAAQPMMEVSV